MKRWLAGSQGETHNIGSTTIGGHYDPAPGDSRDPDARRGPDASKGSFTALTLVATAMIATAMSATVLCAGALVAVASSARAAQEFEGDRTEVRHLVTCLGGNGRIDTNVVNQTPTRASYRLEFAGLTAREHSIESRGWWRMPVTGRADGAYNVVVRRITDGGSSMVVSNQTVVVSCDTNPPVVGAPEVQVMNACRAGRGYVIFQFANATPNTVPYVIEFDGVANRSTSASPFGASVRAVTGRPDGSHGVVIRSGNRVIADQPITVTCQAASPPATATPTPIATAAPTPTAAPSGDAIPASRRIDWTVAGLPGGIPSVAVGASVTDFGAVPNDGQDDASAFQQAIDSVKGDTNNAVYIPPGTWRIGSTLDIDDRVVLRGAGSDQTRLEFTTSGVGIEVITYQRGDWTELSTDATKGDTTITVANASDFAVGGFYEIEQENDPVKMYTEDRWDQDWADQSVGQIGVVTAINGNTLTLREPLNIDFDTSFDARVRKQGLVSWVGIEDLHLDRSANPGSSFTVSWKNAAYTWLSGVESEFTQRYHVATESVYRCEVRNSYLHHAHDYGGGGAGYGVNLGRHVTGCLVEDNVFHTLRHAMLVQVGANGNVLGYNYSFDSRNQDGNLLPDIALHGHYPFANLFEGNVVEEIGYGDWWGPAGPHNTSLRNCVTVEGLWYRDASHGQNIIGNELTDSSSNYIGPRDGSTATDLIVHGNYFDSDGRVEWDPGISSRTIPPSYYKPARPAFYGAQSWPSTGSDIALSCTNPARQRHEAAANAAGQAARCVVDPGGNTETADFAAMRSGGTPLDNLNQNSVSGQATFVRTVFDPAQMRWGEVGVELGVDVSDSDAVNYEYRAELRETMIDIAIPSGTTQAYCMRFETLELPDLYGPITIFQRFNRDNDGPDISLELTGINQFSNAVPNDLQVVAFGGRHRIGDMLDELNTLLVVVYNHPTNGAYKVVLNGRTLRQESGIDTVGSSDGGWVQFGLYPHGFYGDDRADRSKADQIASGQTEIRVGYRDFSLTEYSSGSSDLSGFEVSLDGASR